MAFKYNPFLGTKTKLDIDSGNFKGVLAAAPSSPGQGVMYIDSGDNKLYIYYGSTWQVLHTLTLAMNYLLLETGDYLLLETGDKLALES